VTTKIFVDKEKVSDDKGSTPYSPKAVTIKQPGSKSSGVLSVTVANVQ